MLTRSQQQPIGARALLRTSHCLVLERLGKRMGGHARLVQSCRGFRCSASASTRICRRVESRGVPRS